MLVKELITLLETHNQESEVMFSYNYGDYWNTTIAADISAVDVVAVEPSEYHNTHKVVDDGKQVVIIE